MSEKLDGVHCFINTYKYFSTEDIIFIIREMMYELDPASLKTYLESEFVVLVYQVFTFQYQVQ